MYGAVASLLRNTKARVVSNGATSRSFQIMKEVPQGCPLSPLLFAIYVNSLLRLLNSLVSGPTLTGLF